MDKPLPRTNLIYPYTNAAYETHSFEGVAFVRHKFYLEEIEAMHAHHMKALDDQREMMGRIIKLTKENAALKEIIGSKEVS